MQRLSDFDYELPAELIAQEPLATRDASRMLLIDRANQVWRDTTFVEFPNYLKSNDVLVINNTRVFPARLLGHRLPSGGSVELLLVRELQPNTWEALARPGRRLPAGARIAFGDRDLVGNVIEARSDGVRVVRFESDQNLNSVIDQIGEPPLPPYIKRPDTNLQADRERYQTVYASERGAIAAPTAGLHFTPAILDRIEQRGVPVIQITLHVGYGTFAPVRAEDLSQHAVAAEWYSVSDEAVAVLNETRKSSGRILAVGTTTTRALESAATANGRIESGSNYANLTITPGYRFRAIDGLLTNFHLPRSSLLMLVAAFAGHELIMQAYRHAVAEKYRFYSYGDCMLIL
jgi:S-adenosylmethionine:tRNA ribosyltransferase-isomerase